MEYPRLEPISMKIVPDEVDPEWDRRESETCRKKTLSERFVQQETKERDRRSTSPAALPSDKWRRRSATDPSIGKFPRLRYFNVVVGRSCEYLLSQDLVCE